MHPPAGASPESGKAANDHTSPAQESPPDVHARASRGHSWGSGTAAGLTAAGTNLSWEAVLAATSGNADSERVSIMQQMQRVRTSADGEASAQQHAQTSQTVADNCQTERAVAATPAASCASTAFGGRAPAMEL